MWWKFNQATSFQPLRNHPNWNCQCVLPISKRCTYIQQRSWKSNLVFSLGVGWKIQPPFENCLNLKKKKTTKNRFTKFILKIIKRFLQKSITFCTLLWTNARDMWTITFLPVPPPPMLQVTTKQGVHNNYTGGIFFKTTNNEQKIKFTHSAAVSKFQC